jgi:hypothetical protein
VGFHYFAGFTGGRKSICPGLASAQTIEATHMLALDFERGGRRHGVGTALLDGNAVSEECERVAEIINPAFSINTIVDDQGRVERIFAGHWRAAHRAACAEYVTGHAQQISEKREVVIVSCGGAPYDINMIQAHKALDMAAHACADGGTIVFVAECGDGLGRADFMKWFESEDSRALEHRLRDGYEVNGQTGLGAADQDRTLPRPHHHRFVRRANPRDAHDEGAFARRSAVRYSGHGQRLHHARGAALLPSLVEEISRAHRA